MSFFVSCRDVFCLRHTTAVVAVPAGSSTTAAFTTVGSASLAFLAFFDRLVTVVASAGITVTESCKSHPLVGQHIPLFLPLENHGVEHTSLVTLEALTAAVVGGGGGVLGTGLSGRLLGSITLAHPLGRSVYRLGRRFGCSVGVKLRVIACAKRDKESQEVRTSKIESMT